MNPFPKLPSLPARSFEVIQYETSCNAKTKPRMSAKNDAVPDKICLNVSRDMSPSAARIGNIGKDWNIRVEGLESLRNGDYHLMPFTVPYSELFWPY